MIRQHLHPTPLARNDRLVANAIWKLRRLAIKAKPDHRALFVRALENAAGDSTAREVAADELALDTPDIADLDAAGTENRHRLRINRVLRLGEEVHILTRFTEEDFEAPVRFILVRMVSADNNKRLLSQC